MTTNDLLEVVIACSPQELSKLIAMAAEELADRDAIDWSPDHDHE